jgi:undecaprenyl-diphosphatase
MFEFSFAIILGFVEGITEFIPISSTGHLIVVGHLLGLTDTRVSTFEIFIQLGAILAVALLYRERIFRLFDFRRTEGLTGLSGFWLLTLTTLPALVIGTLAHSFIKERLFNPAMVSVGLGLGGFAILVVERYLIKVRRSGLDSLTWRDSLAVGLFQCLALWPGVSRAAATILGGMAIGVERRTAIEYSFLAAIPVLFAAATYDLFKNLIYLQVSDIPIFAIGFAVAFLSAWVVVKFFIHRLTSQTLIFFGWYRIALALVILFALR